MPIYNFGTGNLIARATGVTNPTPIRFGVLQDVDLEMDRTLKELVGQYSFPVDIAGAMQKWTVKAKHAAIFSHLYNDVFLGQTITPTSGEQVAIDESHTIPSTPYQVTIAPPASGVFVQDMGVFYQVGGAQLTRGSAAATGVYTVTEPAGVYTFAVGDTALGVYISYRYTLPGATTMVSIAISNTLMGSSPTFELELQSNYTNNGGVQGLMNMRLNACKSGKLSMPFKNQDYTIQDFDAQVFADSSGNVGLWTFTV